MGVLCKVFWNLSQRAQNVENLSVPGEPSRSSLSLVQRKSSPCWDCCCHQRWFDSLFFPCRCLCMWLCWVQVVPPVGVWQGGLGPVLAGQGVGCGCLQSRGRAVIRAALWGRDGKITLCVRPEHTPSRRTELHCWDKEM